MLTANGVHIDFGNRGALAFERLAALTTTNLAEIRLSFLSENISPRVTYCSGELKALHINNFNQHIFKRPPYALSMQCWAQELSFHGHDVPYRGEGLASYTHQVVMACLLYTSPSPRD